MNQLVSQDVSQWIASRTAKAMFWLALCFLVSLSCLVVIWVHVPNLHEQTGLATSGVVDEGMSAISRVPAESTWLEYAAVGVLLFTWPVIVLESVFHWLTRPWDAKHRKYHWFAMWTCLCPPLRMCARMPEMGDRVWLPGLGWRRPDKRLRRRLERKFSVPMIAIALMIMPILITEFFFKSQVAQYQLLRVLMHIGTGVIWFAFAAEFILMVSVADKKLVYCKKHWVDLVIILLPLFSFLRSLRLLRATRLAKLMRIPQIGKLARVYRLRGTAIKGVQALVLLDVFHRWKTRSPEKSIAVLQDRLAEIEDDAKEIRRRITRLQRQVDDQKQIDDRNELREQDLVQQQIHVGHEQPYKQEKSSLRSGQTMTTSAKTAAAKA